MDLPKKGRSAWRAKVLRNLNITVGVVHSTSFYVLLVLTLVNLNNLLRLPIWIDYNGAIDVVVHFPLAATLLPFPFITACFHFAEAIGACDYYRYVLVLGVTPHRWIEYTITNGLMTWSIFVLAGVGNLWLLITALFLNGAMQYCGYLQEVYNSARQRTIAPLLLGFIPWFLLWLVTFIYFARLDAPVPPYAYVAIIGSFFWSLAFTIPLFYRYFTTDDDEEANFKVEVMYAALSLTAKLWLDWTVTGGNLANPRAFGSRLVFKK